MEKIRREQCHTDKKLEDRKWFLPYCLNENHWVLVVVQLKQKIIEIYDYLKSQNKTLPKRIETFVQAISCWGYFQKRLENEAFKFANSTRQLQLWLLYIDDVHPPISLWGDKVWHSGHTIYSRPVERLWDKLRFKQEMYSWHVAISKWKLQRRTIRWE